jgi:hypothetical protein
MSPTTPAPYRILVPMAAVMLVMPTAIAAQAPSSSSAASTLTGVRTTARSELGPAAARGVLAWSQNSRRRPRHYDLYVKLHRRTAFKVNRHRTQAYPGDIDGSTLVYSQRTNTGKANIKFLNLDTGRRRSPAGVNTARNWENQPSKAGRWLLFTRTRGTDPRQRIILYNLATDRHRLLARGNGGRRWAQAGEVGGGFATYIKCRNFSFCNAFRYNIATHRSRRVPNPRRKALYAASITGNGTLYYVMGSQILCPSNATLWKFTRHGRRVKLATLGPRFDTAVTSPVVMPNGSIEVYFDAYRAARANCHTTTADIYKVTIP